MPAQLVSAGRRSTWTASQRLGPTKPEGAQGEHWLMPTVIELLRRRRDLQADERAAAP
jgi:hypothetical protein